MIEGDEKTGNLRAPTLTKFLNKLINRKCTSLLFYYSEAEWESASLHPAVG